MNERVIPAGMVRKYSFIHKSILIIMKVLVTGTPGSGKTSLVIEAASHSDSRFVDADAVQKLCEWREFSTGQAIGLVDDIGIKSEDAWHRRYGWYWVLDRLQTLLVEHQDIVLCGSAENVTDCYDYFDKVIVLQKTETELLQNLTSPKRTNPFGKTEQQRAGFMKWQHHLIHDTTRSDLLTMDGNDVSKMYGQVKGILSNTP